MHSKEFLRAILDFLKSQSPRAFHPRQIFTQTRQGFDTSLKEVSTALSHLEKVEKIQSVGRAKYRYALRGPQIQGVIEITARGNGYLSSDYLDRDLYIPAQALHSALPGDTVEVALKTLSRGKKEGIVKKILKRKTDEIVGVWDAKKALIIPKDPRVSMVFEIPHPPSSSSPSIQHLDIVLIKVLSFGSAREAGKAKVIQVFGPLNHPDTEMDLILRDYKIKGDFPKEVLDSLPKKWAISPKEAASREDFRDTLTFTIDPDDAKDFDDALSFKPLPNGHYEVGVHIADVTHYVSEGSPLDLEAQERACSVYLVNKVIPMLPEVLCNHVCSLRPHEDKLTFSVIFELTREAKIVRFRCSKTIIHSDHRFAYEDVQKVLEGGTHRYQDALISLHSLAQKLRAFRRDQHSIFFEKRELKFRLDESLHPIGVIFKVNQEAQQLIEEFMLLANRSVAESLCSKMKKTPKVFRIHEPPDTEKIENLKRMVKNFGYQLDTRSDQALKKSLNELMIAVKGTPEQNLIDLLAIRSMSKASYSTKSLGHYGLSFDQYSHFTSPIRRYADVMTHRLLNYSLSKKACPKTDAYEAICQSISSREIDAVSAERDSYKYMQVRYLEDKIHRVFDATISGVSNSGFFVELIENGCEGLVRTRSLTDDFYTFNEELQAIVGRKSGKKYQLGQAVTVELIRADVLKRQLDFLLYLGV